MKPFPAIACLLIATAGAIVFLGGQNDGNPSSPPASTRVKNRERPTRSASSTAKFIESARQLGPAERQDRIRALSDSDLQSLTRAMIAGYLSAADDTSRRASVPLLTLLAMESGRRDIDGFFAEINGRYDQKSSIVRDLKLALCCAAVVGLAAENPQHAAEIQIPDIDFCLPSAMTLIATSEAINRAWARLDPDAAWQEVSAGLEKGESSRIQYLLAETKDPALRATILDRVSKLGESAPRFRIDLHPGNPNRVDYDALNDSTALGLAEQDPDAAWKWIKGPPLKDGLVPIPGDSPLIDRLFTSPSLRFLRRWAERQPEQAQAFLKQHTDSLDKPEQASLASGLLYHNPVSALDALPPFTDPNEQLEWFAAWVELLPFQNHENAWPVLPYLNETLPRSQILATVSENLDRLHLPSDLEARARQAVRSAQEALGNP